MATDFKNMSIARIGHLSFRSFGHQRQSDICLDPLYMCAVWAVVIPLFVFYGSIWLPDLAVEFALSISHRPGGWLVFGMRIGGAAALGSFGLVDL